MYSIICSEAGSVNAWGAKTDVTSNLMSHSFYHLFIHAPVHSASVLYIYLVFWEPGLGCQEKGLPLSECFYACLYFFLFLVHSHVRSCLQDGPEVSPVCSLEFA